MLDIWKNGAKFLGVKYPILGGAMSWVSERNLVSAISNAGGFGVIACGSMNAALLKEEIIATKKLTKFPFGVNLITMHPDIEELIDICIENNISHVVLAGGMPNTKTINKLKKKNIKVFCFAPALSIAKKLLKNDVDALIIEGSEAGGHVGPVSTSVLVQEILCEIHTQVPIFVAGGIARGEVVASYMKLGAAGCQLGTKFVCATESIAHDNFKKLFIKSSARNTAVTYSLDPNFPVIPVRAIVNKGTEEFYKKQKEILNKYYSKQISKKEAQLAIEHFWAGSLKKAVIDGDIEYGSVMAGQSVGMVTKEQTTKEIILNLVQETEKYFA